MKNRVLLAALSAFFSMAAFAMERIDLNGLWDFRFEEGKSLETVNVSGFTANDKMTVPGCWAAMSRYYDLRGTGIYRRKFVLPENANGAILVVDGFALRMKVLVDGKEIGFSQLAWNRVEFKLGPLDAGEHVLEVAIDSTMNTSKVKMFRDFYDFYPWGGFHHGVWLETRGKECELRSLAVRTRDFRKGMIEIEALFDGEGAKGEFEAEVAFDGKVGQNVMFRNFRAQAEVPNFKLWSPAKPNLHVVEVRTSEGTAKARFGIRQVSTANGRIMLNGDTFYIKGVNRHESHPEFGCTLPRQLMYEDIANLKDMGGNFIRGSHYAQCAAFLDLCDEMGVAVWEESLGWGNGPEQLNDPVFRALQKEQTRMMVRNSINHPCVIISGFLNEPQSGRECCRTLVDELVDTVKREDAGHLVTFACSHTGNDISHAKTDIIAYNTYPCWYSDEMKIGSTEEMRANIRTRHKSIIEYFRKMYQDDRPIIVSETGVKADWGVRDPRGRAQYTEDFQAEYTRLMLEEIFANQEIAGIAIWQFTDCRTYTRTSGMRNRSYGVNTGGLYDMYRRPKAAVEVVKEIFNRK